MDRWGGNQHPPILQVLWPPERVAQPRACPLLSVVHHLFFCLSLLFLAVCPASPDGFHDMATPFEIMSLYQIQHVLMFCSEFFWYYILGDAQEASKASRFSRLHSVFCPKCSVPRVTSILVYSLHLIQGRFDRTL